MGVGRGQMAHRCLNKVIPCQWRKLNCSVVQAEQEQTSMEGWLCAYICVLSLIGVFSFAIHTFCEVSIIGKKLALEQVKFHVLGHKTGNRNLLGE